MGSKAASKTKGRLGFANALFSKVQLRLLALLIGHPNQSFHTSEIIKLARSGTGAVLRELQKLTEAGILTCQPDGNRKKYQANKQAPIFRELNQIILKTTGLVEPLRNGLRQFQSRIRMAFVYGSIAKGTDTAQSDVDVMIVGEDLSYGEIFSALQRVEKTIGRPINPSIMSPDEWMQKLAADNSFVKKVAGQPKLVIFGSEHDL